VAQWGAVAVAVAGGAGGGCAVLKKKGNSVERGAMRAIFFFSEKGNLSILFTFQTGHTKHKTILTAKGNPIQFGNSLPDHGRHWQVQV
jgi:hypothetical protein